MGEHVILPDQDKIRIFEEDLPYIISDFKWPVISEKLDDQNMKSLAETSQKVCMLFHSHIIITLNQSVFNTP